MTRFVLVLLALLAAAPALAQNANQAQLRLIVVDQTGAGIPSATVVVTPAVGRADHGDVGRPRRGDAAAAGHRCR